MTVNPADKVAQRVALWASAFLAVATALGFVNKFLIADPIVRAVSEERIGRIQADSTITERLADITVAQQNLAEATNAYSIADIVGRLEALEKRKR